MVLNKTYSYNVPENALFTEFAGDSMSAYALFFRSIGLHYNI